MVEEGEFEIFEQYQKQRNQFGLFEDEENGGQQQHNSHEQGEMEINEDQF